MDTKNNVPEKGKEQAGRRARDWVTMVSVKCGRCGGALRAEWEERIKGEVTTHEVRVEPCARYLATTVAQTLGKVAQALLAKGVDGATIEVVKQVMVSMLTDLAKGVDGATMESAETGKGVGDGDKES